MFLAQVPDPTVNSGTIGTWLICLFFVAQGLYYLKGLLVKSPKDQFVTRSELNGKLDRMDRVQHKMTEKLEQIGTDVAVLKAKVKPYWEK